MTDALTLREAAERYRFKLATLRHEAREGRLAVYRIGKAYYTTPADIQAMVEKCRVPRSRTSTSIAPGTASASGMALDQSALDAVLRTRLANPSELYGGADGLPYGMERNRAIGNAVAPAVAEIVGRAIMNSAKD